MAGYRRPGDPGTIDLVEDCLEQIHRCRKAALLARARKFREKEDKLRMSNPYALGNVVHKKRYEEEDDDMDEDDEILQDLSAKFSAPAPKVIPLAPVNYNISYKKEESPEDDADRIAQDAYNEFVTEITAWLNNHSKDVIDDDDIRADFADHLVHFYLSSNLDKLPASKKVVDIRKTIASTVEDFASSGKIKLNASTMKLTSSIKGSFLDKQSISKDDKDSDTIETKGVKKPVNDKVISNKENKMSKDTTGKSNISPNAPNGSEPLKQSDTAAETTKMKKKIEIVDPQDKKKNEKQKIKEQYETFMNMKKKLDVHPDNETVQQYSELNDDIQSLISSIQGTRNPL